MADSRTIKMLTIAVWVIAAVVITALVFMRGTAPTLQPIASSGARPIMYEFSTDT